MTSYQTTDSVLLVLFVALFIGFYLGWIVSDLARPRVGGRRG